MAKTPNWPVLVLVCNGSDCRKAGAKKLRKRADAVLRQRGMKRCPVAKLECTNLCKRAPVVSIQPANRWLLETTTDGLDAALNEVLDEL